MRYNNTVTNECIDLSAICSSSDDGEPNDQVCTCPYDIREYFRGGNGSGRRYNRLAGFVHAVYAGTWPLPLIVSGDTVYLYVDTIVYDYLDCSPEHLEVDPEDGKRRFRTPFVIIFSDETDVIELKDVPRRFGKGHGVFAARSSTIDIRRAHPVMASTPRVEPLDTSTAINACIKKAMEGTDGHIASVSLRAGGVATKKVSVTYGDARRLLYDGQLNDTICNAYINLLNNMAQGKRSGHCDTENTFTRCVTCTFLSTKTGGFRAYDVVYRPFVGSKTMHTVDLCIVPIHLPGHWVLVAINNVNETMTWFDSMRQYDAGMRAKVAHLKNALNVDYGTLGNATDRNYEEYHDVRMNECPRQDNGVDCGVFMLQFAKRLMESGTISPPNVPGISPAMIPRLRNHMLWELMHQSIINI